MPIESADDRAEALLRLWHDKKDDGSYFWSDDSRTNTGQTHGYLRATFPQDDPTSLDRLSKTVLLARHNRLMKIGSLTPDPHGGPSQMFSSDYDYENTWNQQPKSDRFWWTMRYRRPYTVIATLGKWGCLVGGCIGIVRKLKARAKSKAKQDSQKTIQEKA